MWLEPRHSKMREYTGDCFEKDRITVIFNLRLQLALASQGA